MKSAMLWFALICAVGVFNAETCYGQSKTNSAKIESAVILSPKNTSIRFLGAHAGKDPDPQLGGFGSFDGFLTVDPAKKQVKKISVSISTNSLWTEIGELTRHLKNADFFDVKKHPTARFVSSKIKKTSESKCEVTGTLTLHGKSAEITFPGEYRIDESGFVLNASFKLDRTKFQIGKPLGGVAKLVTVNINVGQPTVIPPEKEDDDDDED